MLLRRSLGDLEADARRGSTSARRSFFRRKKHQRSSSRDSKELASFSNINLGWYSDSGALNEEVALCSYQRVERLDCKCRIFCLLYFVMLKEFCLKPFLTPASLNGVFLKLSQLLASPEGLYSVWLVLKYAFDCEYMS